jgi:hypothetical protein
VEAEVEALLATVDDEDIPVNFRPCDVSKEVESLKLGKACGFDSIPNECLRHLPRRPLVHLSHLFNHCLRIGHLLAPGKETKIITLPKPSKDPEFPQILLPISLLSITGKLFEKLILRTIQKYTEERILLSASQFGFRAHRCMTIFNMRLADHITLNFNNNMSTAPVFLDIKKAFDTIWCSGLLYKLSELEFSTSLIKLTAFLADRKFEVLEKGELSTPRKIAAGVPQGSILASVLYSLYIHDAPAAPGTHLALFADDTCIYET